MSSSNRKDRTGPAKPVTRTGPVACDCTEEEVLAFVSGELDEGTALSMALHLGECEACCRQATEFVALRHVLSDCCVREAVLWHRFPTPFGTMYLAATHRGLVRISWQQRGDDDFVRLLEERFPGCPVVRDSAALAEPERQLTEYFAGRRGRFDLPVDLSGLSEFDRRVLETALRTVRFGEVVPYSELARRIGKPRAARAVGGALGRNPVAIVVPCHRVVRRDGGLGGYGGGLEWKERLLAIEGREDLLAAS